MSDINTIISKINKLRALTASSNANEAANAAAAANKLIDQYRISEVDLTTDSSETDPLMSDDSHIYETGKVTEWKRSLIHVLGGHYGCAHFNDTHYPQGRKVSRFKLVGRQSDIQITKYMFNWLTTECQRLSDKEAKGKGRVFVSSYCEGFVAGIAVQLNISRKEAKQDATSEAIVKLDARLKQSQDFMYGQFKLVQSKSQRAGQRDYGAFAAGQQKGQAVHLGAVIGGGAVKLLGN